MKVSVFAVVGYDTREKASPIAHDKGKLTISLARLFVIIRAH